MKIQAEIPFVELNILPSLTKDFVRDGAEFSYGKKYHSNKVGAEMDTMGFEQNKRSILVAALLSQYADVNVTPPEIIQKLEDESTFTITTGHQLCLFTGPLYLVYKIATVIHMTDQLNDLYPNNGFVPVFWMATEDHDFEEVSKVNIFQDTITWKDQQQGGVGRMSITNMQSAFDDLKELLKVNGQEFIELIGESLTVNNVAQHYRKLIHGLFGNRIVILDADDPTLKSMFVNTAITELDGVSFQALNKTNKEFEKTGYVSQINGRPINLFWMQDGSRERILKNSKGFEINGQKQQYTKEEMIQMFRKSPESVSPNVVLRPVYQQLILPNLAYVGGGGELAYWLQLEEVFKQLNVYYPMLQVRTSFSIIKEKWLKKWSNLGLEEKNFFSNPDQLKKQFAINDNGFSFNEEQTDLNALLVQIKSKAFAIDKSLEDTVGAESRKIEKGLDRIEKKIIKALKNKSERNLNQTIQISMNKFNCAGRSI